MARKPVSESVAPSIQTWACRIAAAADLNDSRLNGRLADTLEVFARQPNDSIPQAAGNPHRAKAIYRFLDNDNFTFAPLIEAVACTTAAACAGQDTVYLAHDSSSLNYSSLKATSGLGRIGTTEGAAGLLLHSALAIQSDGIVCGLVHVDLWHRPEEKTKEQRHERPFEEKESYKWVRGMQAARVAFATLPEPKRPRLIHLMDREGDIHEVFADILAQGDGAVIRCAQDRKVAGAVDRAHAAVAASPRLGTTTLTVRDPAGRVERPVRLELRAIPVVLTPSHHEYPTHQPLSLHLLEAREANPSPDCKPIHWYLWTTEPITTLEDICERLREYALRWRIEEYHLVLKSGCATEQLQLETAERLCKAIVLYAATAARIVALRDLGRQAPDEPCTRVLNDEEWRVLAAHFDGDQSTPPTIRQAMLWLGRLGGHMGRKRDGLPGVRTLWRGWRDLALLISGYRAHTRQR